MSGENGDDILDNASLNCDLLGTGRRTLSNSESVHRRNSWSMIPKCLVADRVACMGNLSSFHCAGSQFRLFCLVDVRNCGSNQAFSDFFSEPSLSALSWNEAHGMCLFYLDSIHRTFPGTFYLIRALSIDVYDRRHF
jgi:hypothetical protein